MKRLLALIALLLLAAPGLAKNLPYSDEVELAGVVEVSDPLSADPENTWLLRILVVTDSGAGLISLPILCANDPPESLGVADAYEGCQALEPGDHVIIDGVVRDLSPESAASVAFVNSVNLVFQASPVLSP